MWIDFDSFNHPNWQVGLAFPLRRKPFWTSQPTRTAPEPKSSGFVMVQTKTKGRNEALETLQQRKPKRLASDSK
jgi:hypothetical protein